MLQKARIQVLKEGRGATIKHGDKVQASWRTKDESGELVGYSSVGEAKMLDFSDENAWCYVLLGQKEGSSVRFRVDEDNYYDKDSSRKCSLVLIKIVDSQEGKPTGGNNDK